MALSIFCILLLLALILISGKAAAKAFIIVVRVTSFAVTLFLLYKNRDSAGELGGKIFNEWLPYLWHKGVQLAYMIYDFASSSSEKVINELKK